MGIEDKSYNQDLDLDIIVFWVDVRHPVNQLFPHFSSPSLEKHSFLKHRRILTRHYGSPGACAMVKIFHLKTLGTEDSSCQ